MSDVSGTAAPVVAPTDGTATPVVAPVDGTAAPVVAPVDGTAAPVVAPAVVPAPDGTPGKAEDGTADDAPTGAPETYETFSLPDGMEMNTAQLEVFLPIAKDLNLSQEQAQKLVSLDAQQKVAAAQAAQQATDDMLDEWRETTKTDEVLGGANLPQSLAHVNTFLNKFGTPALRQLLDDSGVGNHIEAIRLFAAAGKAMGEDGVIGRGPVNPAKKSHEQLLYPDQKV